MVTYNLSERAEWPVIRAARAAGKGVLMKKGLRSGHLDRGSGIDPVRGVHGVDFRRTGREQRGGRHAESGIICRLMRRLQKGCAPP
jgi:hypothetical protein